MKTMKTTLDQMTKKTLVEPLLKMLAANMEGFAEDQQRMNEVMCTLADELDADGAANDVKEAIYKQTASCALFSVFLGLKANLDHYRDPIARTFLEVDCETYLRENAARKLPEYECAERIRRRFGETLSPEQQEQYEAVSLYINHIETLVPKLAHYYGYLLGNELLPRVIPGYYPDMKLTLQYTGMMQEYLGIENF